MPLTAGPPPVRGRRNKAPVFPWQVTSKPIFSLCLLPAHKATLACRSVGAPTRRDQRRASRLITPVAAALTCTRPHAWRTASGNVRLPRVPAYRCLSGHRGDALCSTAFESPYNHTLDGPCDRTWIPPMGVCTNNGSFHPLCPRPRRLTGRYSPGPPITTWQPFPKHFATTSLLDLLLSVRVT